MKRVITSPEADLDIDTAISYYASESQKATADFLREMSAAYDRISEMPGMGSPRLSRELGIEDLRSYSLDAFPYSLVYFERENHIDLVRVLHTHRDIFNLLFGAI